MSHNEGKVHRLKGVKHDGIRQSGTQEPHKRESSKESKEGE
jgi:hypothetical protein